MLAMCVLYITQNCYAFQHLKLIKLPVSQQPVPKNLSTDQIN